MKRLNLLATFFLLFLVAASTANARDFGWLDELEVKVRADASGFVTKLATRFHIGEAEVKAVISNVEKKADAYMVLRLGELSHRPVNEVMSTYEKHHKKGWGVMAKELGIKPGSREFHALKQGHDLGDNMGSGHGHGGDNGKGNGKGKDKEKGNGKGKK